jgi:hypothetical protein
MEKEDVKRLTDALEDFVKTTGRMQGGFNNGIHFDTGGVAVWISITLVAVLLTVCFNQSSTITDMKDELREMERKLDRAEDYVNQIYRTQHLKPKTEVK